MDENKLLVSVSNNKSIGKMIVKIVIILFFLSLLFFIGVYIYFNNFYEQKIPVITYHNIIPDELWDDTKKDRDFFATKVSTFKKQMKFLKKNGFKTLTLDEYNCWKKGKCDQPRKSVLITFDDGWSGVYKYAAPILKENDQNAVHFVVYGLAAAAKDKDDDPFAYMSLNTIKKSKTEYPNIEIASHSFDMHDTTKHGKRTKEEIKNDIKTFKSFNDTKYWAYPNGYSNKMYEKLLKDNGYELAFGFGPYKNSSRSDNDYHINRTLGGDAVPYWKFVLKMLFRY